MWARIKPWLRRFLGLTFNGGFLALTLIADLLEGLGAASIDWSDVFGSERGKLVAQGILILNVILRAFITRTRGNPDA